MKKIISLFMALIIVFLLCSCGDNADISGSPVQETTTFEKKTTLVDNKVDEKNKWVNENNITVATPDMQFSNFYIPTPDNVCVKSASGKISAQLDNTVIAFGGQEFTDEKEIVNVEDVFPEYFQKVQYVLNDHYSTALSHECKFDIAEKKPVTVNGYEMCRYSGSVQYFDSDKEVSSNYVVYSVKLKNIDCYAYWYVMDISEDLSAGDAVNYNADYIAEHIHE